MYPGKRLFDLALTILAAPLWLPLLAILAVAVRMRLGSPALFRQRRIGLDDGVFTLLKFRTMTNQTDAGGHLLPDADRLPGFGRFLRSTSLDELPELVNVLRGEMSLVGPRPLLPQYLERYSAAHRVRHTVRPGVTGLAQVEGRNALTWSNRFDLDIEYVGRASVSEDIRLLLRTVSVVFARRGVTTQSNQTMPEFTGYDNDSAK